jgi:DNA helicase II / ATP-dependent DNA helicase PcrA
MNELLAALNPVQRQAVLHGDGPLLILAGAGSGKTRTLTHRVAHLIGECGVEPWRILAVTFTNKAAGELRERLQRILGTAEMPWVSTFHSTCVRLLRREIGALGRGTNFVIYDDQDQDRLLRECLRELNVAEQTLTPRAASAYIDAAKNRGVGPEACDRNTVWDARNAQVYALYQAKLRRANAFDFGDLLVETVRLFEEHPDVLDRYRGRFLHVLVDEYQDTNRVQYRLTNLLASRHRNLCVVGDDDQSIYRWRGAEIANILDFERDYPDAVVIRLEQNYRSTGTILDAAGAVVAHNTERKGKRLWTENPRGELITVALLEDDFEEARYVASEIGRLDRDGVRLGQVAVFYRANSQSRALEEALVRQRLPYVMVGGVKFFARAEVKDVLAYLRVLVNPADSLSTKRIINVPTRGIGATTVERIAALEEEAGGLLPACTLALERGLLKSGPAEKVRAFVALMRSFAALRDQVPYPQLASRVIEDSGYGAMLREDPTEEARDRLQNVEELLKGMEEHAATAPTLEVYLEEVALVTDLDSYDTRTDRVTLMTLHAAKGLEFPAVFIVGMEEGLFPHSRVADDDMEEERRLCYVGMTRAMQRLCLTHAQRRRVFGDVQYNARSRFLDEIPPELVRDVASPAQRWATARRQTQSFPARGPVPFATPPGRGAVPSAAADREVRVVYDNEDGLRVGTRVRHATFGVGTIQRLEGRGDGLKATVTFQSAGIKKLILKFAGLEPA